MEDGITNPQTVILFIVLLFLEMIVYGFHSAIQNRHEQEQEDAQKEPDKKIRTFWAIMFIVLPIALIFADNSMYQLQSVSLIAAFPIGLIIILIIVSFFKDAKKYLKEKKK